MKADITSLDKCGFWLVVYRVNSSDDGLKSPIDALGSIAFGTNLLFVKVIFTILSALAKASSVFALSPSSQSNDKFLSIPS